MRIILPARRDGEPDQGTDVPVRLPPVDRRNEGQPTQTLLSAMAYTLVEALRRLALKGTAWAEAQVDTIRASCSTSAPSYASAYDAYCFNSVPPIHGKRFTHKPTAPCAAEKESKKQTRFPHPSHPGRRSYAQINHPRQETIMNQNIQPPLLAIA